MLLDIPVQASADDSLTFCFQRMQDIWPQAVAVVSGDIYDKPRHLRTPGEIAIYESRDKYLTSKLLNCSVASLQIDYEGHTLVIRPSPEGKEAAVALARLPVWRHRVSDRMAAIGA